MSRLLRDHLELHFLVVLWGFTAVLGVLIKIPPTEVVLFRTLISFLTLGIGLLLIKENLVIGWSGFIKMLGVGLLFSGHWILFFLSARVSNVSLCLAGMATTALWTSLLEPLFFKERRLRGVEVVLSLLAIIGIVIIFDAEADRFIGLLLAIGSALLAAVFTIINKGLVKTYKPFVIMFHEMVGAFLATVLFLAVYVVFFDYQLQLKPDAIDWLWLGVLGVICTAYAYSWSVELSKRMSAFIINLTVNLEPVYGILLAWIILGDAERMTLQFYLGTLLILASVFAYPLMLIKRRTPA